MPRDTDYPLEVVVPQLEQPVMSVGDRVQLMRLPYFRGTIIAIRDVVVQLDQTPVMRRNPQTLHGGDRSLEIYSLNLLEPATPLGPKLEGLVA